MIVALDGRLMDESDAAISIRDRGFLFGDAVFETALLHDGGFYRLSDHLERFAGSAAGLRIDIPPVGEIDRILRDVVRANDLRDANVRMTLTRGVKEPVLLVTASAPDMARHDAARRGWRVITARTRRPSTAAVPAHIKAVGRTYAILARHEAADAGVDDALLLTDHGHVCEGPTWNVFWRRGSTLCTPALDAGVLAGITRATLLALAPEVGLRVREGLFDRTELDDADEIFASMTSVGVVPFLELDGRTLPSETTIAGSLNEAYQRTVERESALDPL
ncbi:MAG: aminotransferase class IV family protein [Gemmatimonadetes bacterium]|nr:aminotransferase class IV family protein [Gemmatimonadota bacterium]